MNQSPELDKLAAALAAFQGEVQAIPKGDFNPFFKSKYAGLPDVVAVASPIAAKHGLSVTQFLSFDGEFDLLVTRVMHVSGQYIQDTARMHLGHDKEGNVGPQNHGSAVTYMRRYAYMAALGLVADEDDDGNAATPQPKTVRGHAYNEAKQAHPTTRRPAPQVTEISPKRRLLQACGGDEALALRLWRDATTELVDSQMREADLSETELQLLLSRAAAEIKKA